MGIFYILSRFLERDLICLLFLGLSRRETWCCRISKARRSVYSLTIWRQSFVWRFVCDVIVWFTEGVSVTLCNDVCMCICASEGLSVTWDGHVSFIHARALIHTQTLTHWFTDVAISITFVWNELRYNSRNAVKTIFWRVKMRFW